MSIKSKIKSIIKREKFKPTLLGVFINPYYVIRRELYKAVKRNTKHLSGKMMDFGCGDKPYKKLINVSEYIGLDIEKSGHDHTDEDIDVYYDGNVIPFEDSHFDSVFSTEVFEHVFELESVLKEINRVSKNGATLVITLPFVWNEHEVPYDFARYTSFGIDHILRKGGYEVVVHEKTAHFVSVIFQLKATYIFQKILKVKWAQLLFTPILIAPLTIVGLLFSAILPKDKTLYLNHCIVAKKINTIS